jgi:membrane associated rhomboid family serine protease
MLSNLLRNIPEITKNLLIINILMFLGVSLFPQFSQMLALHYFESDLFQPHQILTHIFMHGSIAHIAFNMFALVMFGSQLEKVWGTKKFLIIYFASAVGAMLLQMLFNWYQLQDATVDILSLMRTEGLEAIQQGKNYMDPTLAKYNAIFNGGMVGASGAIMGLLAAFAYLFPNTELMLIFLPIPVKAKFFIPFYMLVELYLGVNQFDWDNIAHFAHIGGAIVGFVIVLIWNKNRNSFY